MLNTLSHGVGLVVGLLAGIFLVTYAALFGDGWHLGASITYVTTLIILYLSSTLYHAQKSKASKRFFKVLDHSAIYLFIAGSYTLVLLTLLKGPMVWVVFGLQWGIALAGIILKFVRGANNGILDTAAYLAMGWMCLLILEDLIQIPTGALVLIALGGGLYTVGTIFFFFF